MRSDIKGDIDTNTRAGIGHGLEGLKIMIGKAANGPASLGSLQQRIGMQADFAGKFTDSIESGASRLVDTDMEEVSSP